ncbi:MAG: hypothetical protein AAB498_02260 [Patescibacteria group bacterium]
MIRNILIKVWQGETKPGQALEEIRDEVRRGKKRLAEINGDLLYLLEGVRERLLTVNEAEEEIQWIVNSKKRKNKKGGVFIVPATA